MQSLEFAFAINWPLEQAPALLNWFHPVYGPFGQKNMDYTLNFCPDHLQINQVGIECTKGKK